MFPPPARATRAGRRHHDRHGADQYARHIPGFSLNRQDDTQVICGKVGGPNLQVQFDCYHCYIIGGDLAVKLKRDMPRIGHMQIARAARVQYHGLKVWSVHSILLFSLILRILHVEVGEHHVVADVPRD